MLEYGTKPKVGLVVVSLPGERVDLAERFGIELRKALSGVGLDIVTGAGVALDGTGVSQAVSLFKTQRVDCIVYLIGTWVSSPDVVTAIQDSHIASIVWGVPEGASFSSVGANAVHGSLDELGIHHWLVYGLPDDSEALNEARVYARAAMARNALWGSKFGLIGGRSVGMYPSTTDPIQVKRVFGVEIEHVDQLLLLEEARSIPDAEGLAIAERVTHDYGRVDVPRDVLLRSAKVYCALKRIADEHRFDFMGVKCLEEFINAYVSCCLAVSLLNDEGLVTACQTDINAAMAMKVISLLTAQPAIFADINMIDKKTSVARLVNCGTMATSLALNPADVDWGCQYEYMGDGRGACPYFCCKPGKITFGSFSRIQGEYIMQIVEGEAFSREKSAFAEVRDIWPHAFIKLDADPNWVYQNIRSNHSVAGYGNIRQELVELCYLLNVRPIVERQS